MPEIEKTNVQLGGDVTGLVAMDTMINAELDAMQASDLTMVTTLTLAGLTDASGTNGDVFVKDASVFIKWSGRWYDIPCVSKF